MRKTIALVLATAFVATLPSLASAKSRHHRHYAPVRADDGSSGAGARLAGNALHQLIVPFEVTFAPRPEPMLRRHRRHRVARS
jgi:hypothetical protein